MVDTDSTAPAPPLLVSASPHIRARESARRIMWTVVLALVPAWIAGLVFFGWYAAVLVVGLSVATAVVTEAVIQKVRGLPVTVRDGSAVLTGVLYAFVLPANSPWYVVVVGAFVAIALGKQIFGGLGCNIWNPALVGRAFVQMSFPQSVTLSSWPILKAGQYVIGNAAAAADCVTKATPLHMDVMTVVASTGERAYKMWDLFLGARPGCIGEVSVLALLIGGIYLIAKKIIDWRVPVFTIGTLAVFSFIVPYIADHPATHRAFFPGASDPALVLYQVLSGGLFIGAFFMATDYVSSPMTRKGRIVFAIGIGVIVGCIRLVSKAFPEGVCYAILLMNTATPLIDRWTTPRVFGAGKGAKK